MATTPAFSDPQFLDATAPGGLTPAFGMVSGSLAAAGSGVWAYPGILSLEARNLALPGGMVLTVQLPAPWGLVTSGGAVVNAHGTQTGQDTQVYQVDFTSLVPATGSVTAYLAATPIRIGQDPIPIPGPPPGHPAYDPNFVPMVGYAASVDSVALSAVTGGIDNINVFELERTTLTAGQSSFPSTAAFSVAFAVRAANLLSLPEIPVSAGGNLTPQQCYGTCVATTAGITSTLAVAGNCGGLTYRLVNPTSGNWTISTQGGDVIAGFGQSGLTSMTIPASGAMSVWGNAASGIWQVVGFSPNMVPHGSQEFSNSGTFTVPNGVYSIHVRCWAGGAAGAGSTSFNYSGGGGGGGEYREGPLTVTPGTSYTVTVGAGGTGPGTQAGGNSSFGSLIVSTGGGQAGTGSSGGPGVGGTGGSGGSGGTVEIPGGTGGISTLAASAVQLGQGGSAFGSSIALSALASSASQGAAPFGTYPGGGGSGSNGLNTTLLGNGAAGLVIVDW